jgi:hypothetical protein
MTFREFVTEQINRLKSFANFSRDVPEDGQKEIRRWLEERAGCDPKARSESTIKWLEYDEGARRVKAVIDECLTFETMPDLRTMRAVWDRMYPPMNQQRAACDRCQGSGWITVEGPYGTSAAHPCSHRAPTEADQRMGVRISPTVERMYQAEARELPERIERQSEFARKNPTKASVPQAILDAIGGL